MKIQHLISFLIIGLIVLFSSNVFALFIQLNYNIGNIFDMYYSEFNNIDSVAEIENKDKCFFESLDEINSEKYDDAIILLEKHLTASNNYEQDSYWYLGLIHCKKNNKMQARKYFKKLSKSKNNYTDKSKKIMNLLK